MAGKGEGIIGIKYLVACLLAFFARYAGAGKESEKADSRRY
jgi:hypothetical protein